MKKLLIAILLLASCTLHESTETISLIPLTDNNGGLINTEFYSIDHEPFYKDGHPMDIIYLATEDNGKLEIVKIPLSEVEMFEEYGVDPEIRFEFNTYKDIKELKAENTNVDILNYVLRSGCSCGSNKSTEKKIKIYIPIKKYNL